MTSAARTTYEDVPAVTMVAAFVQRGLWPAFTDRAPREDVAGNCLAARAAAVGLFCMSVERAEVRSA